MKAVSNNQTPIIRFLLEKGNISPNIKNSNGNPILCRLAYFGNNEMIKLCLKKGGDINAINEQNKWNALHEAAYNGQFLTAKYLVSLGIDFKAKNKDGKTPFDLAKSKNHHEIAEILQEKK